MVIIDILVFLIVLGVVVLVHEFGHFIAAKTSGVKVEEFGVGFPPRLWKKTIGETQYFIGAIPFGGMTRIYGMDDVNEEKDKDSRGYESKSAWKKLWICGGGVVMNLLFAAILFYGLIAFSGFKSEQGLIFSEYHFPFGNQVNQVMIAQVSSNTPAEVAGLKSYDVVLSVDNKLVSDIKEFSNIITENKGKEIALQLRDGRELKITPRAEYPSNEGPLGVGLREMAVLSYPTVPEKAFVGFLHAYNITDYSISALGYIFSSAIANKSMETVAYSMTGPVGIFAITKIILQKGLFDVINLIAILSIALGVSNLIPIPAMDGAKLIYIGLQSANKKVFSTNLQARIESYGAIFLIFLAVAIIIKDFIQFKDIIFK
ncbi:MAG: M50 family metallopeptidase [Candidatus Paceibacterota bacterium]|jgi:regulator of sigma E protease